MAGTRNTLGDLTNHLFAELERLGDESLSGDALREEIERARAEIVGITERLEAAARKLEAAS